MVFRDLATVIALAACYDARPFPGAPCAMDRTCPSGLVCDSSGLCELPGDSGPIDAPRDAIAGGFDADAWSNGSCSARASYSPQFGSNQTAYDDPATNAHSHYEELDAALTDAAMPDLLTLGFQQGYGVFQGHDVHTGTYQVGSNADDLTAVNCGLCGTLYTKANTLTEAYQDAYFWEAGTVVLTSVSGTLSGSLSDLVFRQVDFTGSGSDLAETDDPSGCMTRIVSATFSATLQTTPGAAIHLELHRH